jgi:hypothetical protein
MAITSTDIARWRLHNQYLAQATFETPGDVVRWLGAVQAQDYLGSLWAIGLRMRQATEAAVEQAIADRAIIRTWPMRGTLHFVAPEDARWMLKLLTPRIVARNKPRLLRQFDLDDAVIARSKDVVLNALRGGKRLTRNTLYKVLEAAHIPTANQRGPHISWWLAQECVICFGARQGKQPTFVLLDEWAPATRTIERDEALAELARRYFVSHGPATVRDFAWWSGLAAADARAGLEMAKPHLAYEVVDGRTYWLSPIAPAIEDGPPSAYLLPAYDEYTVGYTDRGDMLGRLRAQGMTLDSFAVLGPTIVVDGQIVDTWKRTFDQGSAVVARGHVIAPTGAEVQALAAAAQRYSAFLGLPVVLA